MSESFSGSCGPRLVRHADRWFSRVLGACAGRGELSSGVGSLLSGGARRLVVSLSCYQFCCPLLQHFVAFSNIKGGLQQSGEGCNSRLAQVSQ